MRIHFLHAVSLCPRHAVYQQYTGTNWPADGSLTTQTQQTALAECCSAGLGPPDCGAATLDRTADSSQ